MSENTTDSGSQNAAQTKAEWKPQFDHDLKFSDYLINHEKLRPRLAAMFQVDEDKLQCAWWNGTYFVKGVPATELGKAC